MKTWLQGNDMKKYLTGKIYLNFKSISIYKSRKCRNIWPQYQKLYIDRLDDIVNKGNRYYRTIKMKPVDVKLSTHIVSTESRNNLKLIICFVTVLWYVIVI